MIRGGYQVIDLSNVYLEYDKFGGVLFPHDSKDINNYKELLSNLNKPLLIEGLNITVTNINGEGDTIVEKIFKLKPFFTNFYIKQSGNTLYVYIDKNVLKTFAYLEGVYVDFETPLAITFSGGNINIA